MSTGSFGTTACPSDAHLPDTGAPCGIEGITCEYSAKGDKNDPREICRDQFKCEDGGLSPTQTADASACDTPGDCPDAGATSCNSPSSCRIGNSVICYCINNSYSCSDTQGAGGGCPTYYPNMGQTCMFPATKTCTYGVCGESDYVVRTCAAGRWIQGAPAGGCDAGAQAP